MLTLVTPAQAFDNWLSLRDAGVVRQERDFSCGAAALATVLTHYYGEPVSEAALLEQLLRERVNTGDTKVQQQALSFADLAMLAGSRHYPSMGLAVAFEDLKKLKLPVIVALVIEGRGHFSVLRRVDSDDRVFLADPSWGNRQLGKQTFLRSFSTPGTSAQGRILIIGSKRDSKNGSKSGSGGDERFRHRPPRRALMAPGV